MSDKKLFSINFTEEQLAELRERAKKSEKDVSELIRDQLFNPAEKELIESREIYKGGIQQMQFLNSHLITLDRDLKLIFNKFNSNFSQTNEETRKLFYEYHNKTEETFGLIKGEIGKISGCGSELKSATQSLKRFEMRVWISLVCAIILSGFLSFFMVKFINPDSKLQKDILIQQQILNEKHNEFLDWFNQASKKKK